MGTFVCCTSASVDQKISAKIVLFHRHFLVKWGSNFLMEGHLERGKRSFCRIACNCLHH